MGTVSNVLNRPEVVEQNTRNVVIEVIRDLGYARGASHRVTSAHRRRNSFAAWVFRPAVTGCYPAKAPAKTTMMDQLRTPKPLMDLQMGHSDGSVQARYTHVTQEMIDELRAGPTRLWTEALDSRRQMNPRSAVPSLDRLLREGAPK